MSFFTKQIALAIMLLISFNGFGATIKGHVFDRNSKEQLVGAYVSIKSLSKGTVTELDGSFTLTNITPGTYILNVSYLGYIATDSSIKISTDNEVLKLEIDLASESKVMEQVEIKTKAYGGSDEFATKAEQKSISLVNIVSANAIAISPDISVANVMQRVSGVIMDRGSNGDAQYAAIRGMDKKYNTTLVNGVKIPSPNDRDRYVPLDIFPAELLERLEVSKTLLPRLEADGTGGVVNMVMKNAPDKLMADASIGTGYTDYFQHNDFLKFDSKDVSWKSPNEIFGPLYQTPVSYFSYNSLLTSRVNTPYNANGSLTLGNRFFKKKLGIIVSGSLQSMYKGAKTVEFQQVATVQPVPPGTPMVQPVSDDIVRHYSYRINRTGTEAKIDYNFNDKNSISLFATYLQLNEFRVRVTDDSTLGGFSRFSGFVGPNAYHYDVQTMQTLQDIYNSTLQGKHALADNLELNWTLAASQATKRMPDIAKFAYDQQIQYNLKNDAIIMGVPEVGSETFQWTHNRDNDLSGYISLLYKIDLIPTLKTIEIGGMYRNKERENYYNKYTLNSVNDSANVYQLYHSIPASKYYFGTNEGMGEGYQTAATYGFTENISAYYAQLHNDIGEKIKVDWGVRVENTYESYLSNLPVTLPGRTGTYNYLDAFPSIIGKYEFSSNSALRASYYKSINRPAFSDLVPAVDPNVNESYDFIGNPYLQPAHIDNYDLRYELFPKGLDQLMVGVFYKHISTPIELGLYQASLGSGLDLTPTNNPSDANNYGLELVYRKFFGNFGVSANYTYTKSLITTKVRVYYHDSTLPSNQTYYSTANETRPLQGQADHVGNISFLYKDGKRKIDAQLAFNYTGKRINTVSGFLGLDTWEKPTFSCDASCQKKFGKRFTAYAKVANLFNTGREFYVNQPNGAYNGTNKLYYQESSSYFVVYRAWYNTTYMVGLKFKL